MRNSTAICLLLAHVVACGCERADRAGTDPDSPHSTIAKGITTASGVEMVLVPAGRFRMGSDRGDADQQPAHEVEIDAFLMDRYEVTQSVYTQCDPINGSHFKGPKLPTEMISWDKAALYCNLRSEMEGLKLCYNELGECDFEATGYRLPTEAEWEYACRAGSTATFSFGADAAQLGQFGWFKSNANKKTHEVGKKLPNEWGLYDMHGNVAEWCNDLYGSDYYRTSPVRNPRGPAEGEKYVLRGGHWGASVGSCESAFRMSEEPGFSDACFARDAIGFRCVRKAPADVTGSLSARPATLFALSSLSSVQDGLKAKGGVGLVDGDIFLQHHTGAGHPERKERLTAIAERLRRTRLIKRLVRIEPRPAAERWLTTVHSVEHLRKIRQQCEKQASDAGSRDTPVSADSYRVALHAAGGALAAVDAVMDGKVECAFCAVRPPGHHATRDRAMGFCLMNNVAVAARYAQQKYQLEKVLIVDWDVHHGNGTEAIFLNDATVFYFSVHQFPFYPGTGSADQRGAGEGEGTTLNVPLGAGAGDVEFCRAIERDLARAADEFQPDFVFISAGFDAHQDDPLGGMRVTAEGFARMTRAVKRIAQTHCEGRVVSLLEGGYDLEGLAASVEAHVRALIES